MAPNNVSSMPVESPPANAKHQTAQLHPLPIRIMHWMNALSMLLLIFSGWGIYNDEVIFGALHFAGWMTLGAGPEGALQWHFFAMWILMLNGVAYVSYGFWTGRLRRMLLPVRVAEILAELKSVLAFKLVHEDLTKYNPVQKLLYLGVMIVIVIQVLSGLVIWKPVQFSELAVLFYDFQTARVVHFLGMAAIVGFLLVHVALAFIVPQTIVAMIFGGPQVSTSPEALEPDAKSSDPLARQEI